MTALEWGVVSTLLAAAVWTDVRTMKIPNALNGLFAAAGCLYHGWTGGMGDLAASLTGGLVGMLPTGLLYVMKGMGGGDVKWFGAFGVWAGAQPALYLLFWSILFAGLASALLLMLRIPGLRPIAVKIPWPWGNAHPAHAFRGVRIPFMLAVIPGFMTVWSTGLG